MKQAVMQPRSKSNPGRHRACISFHNVRHMPELLGDLDQNLYTVENLFNVAISARGTEVVIEGIREGVEKTETLLRDLYRHIECGGKISEGYIHDKVKFVSTDNVHPINRDFDGPSIKTRKKTIFARNEAQASYIKMMQREELVFALGPAGTGKTYLAVAQAVSKLITGEVERLVLSRPAVEAGEKLGFLPGDMKEKVDPYLRPIYDALHDCLPSEQVERRIASGEIEVAPLAFMRGRTLAGSFVILDEAQNTTPAQMKMFLTRFGEGSRMIICGDPNQSDIPGGLGASGLTDAIKRLEGVQGIGMTRFNAKDVVRHPIVGRIVDAYEG